MRILSFAFLFFGYFVNAQQYITPNYETIQSNIENTSGPLFYDILMNNYMSGDTSFTNNELVHLYFGFVFDDSYNPFVEPSGVSDMKEKLQTFNGSSSELNALINTCNSILNVNPFHTNTLNYLIHFHTMAGNEDLKILQIKKLRMIEKAIRLTGNGMTDNFPFHIINQQHENFILSCFNLVYDGGQTMTEHIEFLDVTPNNKNIERFYFDISACLDYQLSN